MEKKTKVKLLAIQMRSEIGALKVNVDKVEKLSIEEFMHKFKDQTPELQMKILENFQQCIFKARWGDVSNILEAVIDKEESLYTRIQEREEQNQSKE